jgi:protein NEDD1
VHRAQSPLEQHQQQQGVGATGFALQLVQRGLEESLGAVQRAIHEEVQNLHLELLRQFHIQQVTRLLHPGLMSLLALSE